MHFEFSEEQRLLREMVDRLITDEYDFEARMKIVRSPEGWSRERWARFAKLGLLAVPFAESEGGMGGGAVETMIVGEAFGRGLVVEPYLSSVVMSGAVLRNVDARMRETLLPPLLQGGSLYAVVEGSSVEFLRGRVGGTADLVLGGQSADWLLVMTDEAVLLVGAAAAGLSRRSYALHGGGQAADIRFDSVAVEHVLAQGRSISARVREAAIAFLAAEAVGACQALLDLTVSHLKDRVQFDLPLGRNQALQHRAAEMLVELEQVRSAALYAAAMVDHDDAVERSKALSAVKIVVGKSSRFIGQQAVQLHGGIGVAEEHAVGHYFKRLTAIGMLFASSDDHATSLAEAGGFVHSAPYWETT